MSMVTIYKKINSLSQYTIKEANIGKLINLVSNDFNTIERNFYDLCSIATFPLTIIYALIILYFRFGIIGILSPLLLLLSYWISIEISKKYENESQNHANISDQRIKLCNEVIEGIRLIKMYAWEKAFQQMINIIRQNELKTYLKMNMWLFISTSFNVSSILIVLSIQLIIIHYMDGDLTISKIFSTIYLLQYVKQQIFYSGTGIFTYREFLIIAQRFLDILRLKNAEMQKISSDNNNNDQQQNDENEKQDEQIDTKIIDIYFANFNAYWNSKEKQLIDPQEPVLKNINLQVKKGTLLCIVGKIGSGKSSIIQSILKEVPVYSGQFYANNSIALVEQEPYIFNSTVRENITFGKKFEKEKYDEIVKICCLEQDFEEFPNSDMTEIGERGINISGGQKARISLARAVYSEAEVYLLDDPLSAVDAVVGRSIFNNVLKRFLLGKTIILVTHQIPYTKEVDQIIILENGQISSQGTFQELEDKLQIIIGQLKFEQQQTQQQLEIQELDKNVIEEIQNKQEQIKKDINLIDNKEKGQLTNEEDEENVNVDLNTYKRYYSSTDNNLLWLLTLALFCTPEIVFVFYTDYLGLYEESSEKENMLFYSLIIGLVYLLNMILKYYLINVCHIKAIRNMHNKLVESILRSKIIFFDKTPSGRIVNAFSNDTGVIDTSVLYCSCDFYEIIIGNIILIIAAISLNYLILIVVSFQIICITSILLFAKDLIIYSRKFDLNLKNPIFTFFNTSIGGVLPIKVYRQQDQYVYNFVQMVNNSCKASLLFVLSSRGFAYSIHQISNICSCISIYCALKYGNSSNNSQDISKIIIYLLYLVDNLQWGIRQKIQFDVGLSSCQRNFKLHDTPSEPPFNKKEDESLIQNKFPQSGQVEFKNVYFRYRKKLDLVLKGVNFQINSNEKIGIVGRTGSGKSSLLQVLFRMYEIEKQQQSQQQQQQEQQQQNQEQESLNNSGIFIDGYNIEQYGLHLTRSSVSIIPQVPFIFTDTIRRNLDPLQMYKDEQLWQVLEQTQLKEVVEKFENKLDTDMTQVNSVFSVGQKQLICLGRAILKQSKILVLDEATANIDMQTDEIIQQKIKQLFKNCTIITIAHRLNTIADYDKVIVMDNGTVAEFNNPFLLLVENSNDEFITKKDGRFANLVKKTGKENSKLIFEIAKNKYQSNLNNQQNQ